VKGSQKSGRSRVDARDLNFAVIPNEPLQKLLGIGRALERGREIAPDVRKWMREVDQTTVEAALAKNDDPARGDDLRRAATRIAMQRGWAFSSALPRSPVAPAAADPDAEPPSSPLMLSADVLAMGVPTDEVVLAYVQKGELARYVEGVAAANEAFAEELRGTIDALTTARETVGSVARAWRGTDASVALAADNVVVPIRSSSKRSWVPLQIAMAAALVLGVGAYYIREQRHETAVAQALKEREAAEKNAQLEKLMKELEQQQQMMALAQQEAANAKDDADRAAAQAKLFAASEQQKKTQTNIARVKGAAAAAGAGTGNRAKAACTCQAGDPLCACL